MRDNLFAKGESNAGPPVQDKMQEELCKQMIIKSAKGEDVSSYFAGAVLRLPGIWSKFDDKTKTAINSKIVMFVVPVVKNGKQDSITLPGGGILKENLPKCLKLKAFQDIFIKMK